MLEEKSEEKPAKNQPMGVVSNHLFFGPASQKPTLLGRMPRASSFYPPAPPAKKTDLDSNPSLSTQPSAGQSSSD